MTLDLSRATWRKSSRSNTGGNCVEVAPMSQTVAVRDSKDPAGPQLSVGTAAWSAFLAGVATASHTS